MASKRYGEKKSVLVIKSSRYNISKEEKTEIEEEVREYLESTSIDGNMHALLPLAKWYITVPKSPDYANGYKWLSIATAFNLENAKAARDKVSDYVEKDNLSSLQEEAKKNYDIIKTNIESKTELDGE